MRYLAIFAMLALAGCNPDPVENTILENEAEVAKTNATMRGWDRVFGAPDETIGFANQYGFRAPRYAADGPTFLSQGAAITLSQSAAQRPNTGEFEVAGPRADAIERVAFKLNIADPADAATAKQRFTDVIRNFLSQYDLDPEGALDAIASETSSDAPVAGQPAVIAVTPGEGETRTITVTFTRPAASAPDIQGQ